jgi:nucleotide-binding universal stress UspA family protein
MFENVLVGVDGGDGGRDAIALARQLGGERARYVLMNVVSWPVLGSGAALWLAASCRFAEELLERERSETGIDATLATDCGRSPARALHDRAHREGSDLIVVGASHRHQLLRVLLGDNAIATVDGSPCAIAIAPSGYRARHGTWTTIAVGDDGSAQSSRAMGVARRLSSAHHAAIQAVSVIGPENLSYRELVLPDWSPVADRPQESRQAQLDAGRGVHGRVLQGDAVDVLADLSDEVDLLIIGTRGQGRLGRWINGSTAHRLAARTRCPLLILPSNRRAATADPDTPSPELRTLSRQGS